jgi:hypothetical protein
LRPLSLVLTIMIFFADTLHATSCPVAGSDAIKHKLKGKGLTNVVFFASWCAGCKPHLEAKSEANTIYIATFDEQKRAEKVLDSFKVEGICFTSDEFAEELGVRSLPAKQSIAF